MGMRCDRPGAEVLGGGVRAHHPGSVDEAAGHPLEDYLAVEREPVEHVHVARVRDEEAPPVPPAGYRQPRAVDDVAVGVRRLVQYMRTQVPFPMRAPAQSST